MTARIIQGDALERLRELPSGSVHAVVTSPAYWGLRKYQAGPQEMGSEATPEEHLERLVAVFREVRRVLRRGSWRPTRAWEPIFMLTKGGGYYADGEAGLDSPP